MHPDPQESHGRKTLALTKAWAESGAYLSPLEDPSEGLSIPAVQCAELICSVPATAAPAADGGGGEASPEERTCDEEGERLGMTRNDFSLRSARLARGF
jgi:hypothetical protein